MTGDRILLTLGTFAFAAIVVAMMWWGWSNRARRQVALPAPPPPPVPRGDVLVGATPGLFVGTVIAGQWLDRVVVHNLADRSAGWISVSTDGVHSEREGLAELFLPFALLVEAHTGDALAGKVVGRDGLLVLTWRLGDPAAGGRVVQSAFRAEDHGVHARLAGIIAERSTATTTAGEST